MNPSLPVGAAMPEDTEPRPRMAEVVAEKWWQRSAVKAAALTTVYMLFATLMQIRAIAAGRKDGDVVDTWLEYGQNLVGLWGPVVGVTVGAPAVRRVAGVLLLGLLCLACHP